MRKFKDIVMLCLLVSASAQAEEINWSWVQTSKGKSTSFVARPEFKKFLDAELPTFKLDLGFEKMHKKNTLSEALMAVLGGSPNLTVTPNDHSVVLSACRSHSCDEKGFYWADSLSKTSVMGVLHYVFDGKYESGSQLLLASKNYKCGAINKDAISQIKVWLAKESIKPTIVRCLESDKFIEIQI